MGTASRTCTSCHTPVPADAAFCPNCGVPTPTHMSHEFGDDFEPRLKTALQGRYRIDKELGRGGMAVVFLAHDLKHDRAVALKVMRPELAASLGTERFLREIQIAAKLNHPHILAVHDSGEAEGFLYYVMPLVEGESLRERMQRLGPLPIEESLRIAREVASALSYAHSLDIVHRDIKPENILLHHGEAMVADFGIARAVTAAGGERLTETGIAIGTPLYMSPEQAGGAKPVTGQADLYSLACVLYEMLAGDPPFTAATTQAILARHALDPVPALRTVRSTVPDYVDAAVCRALAKVPADRPETGTAFAESLMPEHVVARGGRRRWPRRVAGAAALVVGLGAAWGLFLRGGGPTYERLAVLPPANLMNDSGQAYFVQGVHNALISELQKAGVKVKARTSVLRYENTQQPIREIARELGVDALIESSVLRTGDSVEIEVKLVDGRTQEYVTDPIVRRSALRDVERLYRGLTVAIAAEIRTALTPQAEARLASAREVDPQAYEDYLQGVYHLASMTPTPSDFDAALECFERALRRDSTYALAYAGVAQVWLGRSGAGFASIRYAQAQARAAAQKALALDSTLAEVQMMAYALRFHEWDWAGAETTIEKALQINPNNPDARILYSFLLVLMRRPAEARAQMDSAVALDPSSGDLRAWNGVLFVFERRYEDAIAEYRRADELGSGFSPIWDALDLTGAQAEASTELRKFLVGAEDQEVLDGFDRGYAEGGYRTACRRVADILAARPVGGTSGVWRAPYSVASWYASARDEEHTIEWLERAYEERDGAMTYVGFDPMYEFVRQDPRFQDLLRRMNLPE
jgi:TolB-like protein